MSTKIIYAARVHQGNWDDYQEVIQFVSPDKQLVTAWVKKFNKVVNKARKFYDKRRSTLTAKSRISEDHEDKFKEALDITEQRLRQINNIHHAVRVEVEYRSGGPDLKKMEKAVDKLLAESTKESIQEWLDEKRK